MTYGGFKRMTTFCKTDVPPAVTDVLESIKDNDEAVKAFGIQLGADMCRQLLEAGGWGVGVCVGGGRGGCRVVVVSGVCVCVCVGGGGRGG
jgi:5,10-methylenetetrahydrofolate reductase